MECEDIAVLSLWQTNAPVLFQQEVLPVRHSCQMKLRLTLRHRRFAFDSPRRSEALHACVASMAGIWKVEGEPEACPKA